MSATLVLWPEVASLLHPMCAGTTFCLDVFAFIKDDGAEVVVRPVCTAACRTLGNVLLLSLPKTLAAIVLHNELVHIMP
jgi:hypothetical protein